jgi:hypothetical protein
MPVGPYALTSLANLKSWLGITTTTDDAVLEAAIDRATSRIESYLERNILQRAYTEWRSGANVETIRLYQWPVLEVANVFSGAYASLVVTSTDPTDIRASVQVNQEGPTPAAVLTRTTAAGVTTKTTLALATYPTTAALGAAIASAAGFNCSLGKNMRSVQLRPRAGADTVLATVTLYGADIPSEYTYDFHTGRLSIDRAWFAYWPLDKGVMPSAMKSILIEYTAGYATVPPDVEQACIEVASTLYRDRRRDGNLVSEGLGDYSYSRATAQEMSARLDTLLARWKDIA